ncbi:DUF1559 domain-containing protein [Maioricimonas sp. JC845]|uniref:DUF1559 domain-containing protein n=1 Tax=Maioricimonas sp. JC845 TaxID=3232138 RepID=UPI003458A150
MIRRSRRRGLSLVELLVVMGIIGLLVSFLLPAVQAAREAARGSSCSGHLRQIALALASYEEVHQYVPPAISPILDFDTKTLLYDRNLSALAQLLPYLDQGALYDRIDLSENGSGARNEPPTSGVNADLLRAHVSVFACPSDDVPQGGTSYRICDGTTHGSGIAWTWGRPLVKVRDGRSQTVFFSERVTGDRDRSEYSPWRDQARTRARLPDPAPTRRAILDFIESTCRAPAAVIEGHFSYLGSTWLLTDVLHTCYNHALGPNSRIPDCRAAPDGYGAVSARSHHPGGVYVVMGDGATRFVNDSIDLAVWRGLATIDAGETLPDF